MNVVLLGNTIIHPLILWHNTGVRRYDIIAFFLFLRLACVLIIIQCWARIKMLNTDDRKSDYYNDANKYFV